MSAGAKQIVVLGGGFAGLWSAVGAARKLDELGVGPDEVTVTLVNRDAYHGIRVRNYETDLRAPPRDLRSGSTDRAGSAAPVPLKRAGRAMLALHGAFVVPWRSARVAPAG